MGDGTGCASVCVATDSWAGSENIVERVGFKSERYERFGLQNETKYRRKTDVLSANSLATRYQKIQILNETFYIVQLE